MLLALPAPLVTLTFAKGGYWEVNSEIGMSLAGYLLPKEEIEIVCLKVAQQPSVNSKIGERQFGHLR